MYIDPTLHIHSTLEGAKDFLKTYGPYHVWSDKPRARISDLVRGRRNLIVGEPGVGKTLLVEKLRDFFNGRGVPACVIGLKERNSIDLIDQYITKNSASDFVLLLDGLDEVQASLFPATLEKIADISKTVTQASIYISSRSVFMSR